MNDSVQEIPATKPIQYFFRLVDMVALEAAYYLSFLTVPLVRDALLSADTTVHLEITFSVALLVPFIWLFILDVRGLYGDPARIPYSQLISRLFQTTLLGLGAMSLVLFALKEGEFSRLLLFIFGIYSFLILAALRVAEKWYFVNRHRTGHYAEKMLVVGFPDDVQRVERLIADGDSLRDYAIVGYFDTTPAVGAKSLSVPYLGGIKNLNREIRKRHVSEVLVIWSSQGVPELDCVLDTCRNVGTRVRIIPSFALEYGISALSIVSARAESFWGVPSIVLSTVKWKPEQEFLKRLIDIVVSALLLLVLSPLLLIVAVAIKLSSPGPILYRWKVRGRNNRELVGYKFRTMVANADALKASLLIYNEMQGPVFKIKNDPRITRLGRILRKYSIDELPQLWSVLKGDMSLVGPRPVFPSEFERFEFWQMRKLSVRPGITCLWQVNGRNKISDFNEWIKLDLKYIDNWSLWLDLKILAQTALVVFKGTGK